MNPLIQQCLTLAGPMPDPEAHQRYLATLTPMELSNRAATLVKERQLPGAPRPKVEFWTRMKRRPLEVCA